MGNSERGFRYPKEAMSAPKPKHSNVLRIASEMDYLKVRIFLESVARGSKNSKHAYQLGLKHLQSKDFTSD